VSTLDTSRLERVQEKAAILAEALPYIREFSGSIVVIKYGGHAMEDPALADLFAQDVVLMRLVGMNPVVVHGGGPEITAFMDRLSLPVEFVEGLRVSDEATVEVVKMVLVGKVNKDIVLLINRHGQPAIGLCGDDGLLFRAARQAAPSGQDIGFVGRIERVNVGVIEHIASDYIPVIASIGLGYDGQAYNINADTVAAEVAVALGAAKLILMTDVPGVMDRQQSVISVINRPDAREMLAGGAVSGGMIPKLEACMRALDGVPQAHVIDGRTPHSLLLELFTEGGIGTMVTQ